MRLIIVQCVRIGQAPSLSGDGIARVETRIVADIFPERAHQPYADSAWQLLTAIEKSNCPRKIGLSMQAPVRTFPRALPRPRYGIASPHHCTLYSDPSPTRRVIQYAVPMRPAARCSL